MRKAAASVQSICRPDSISAALVSPTRPELLAQLQEIECCLAVALGHDLRCRRAVLLDRLGRTAESRAAFLEILKDAPDHADTLNAFGALLYRTGYRTAARSVFAQAVATHPEQPAGRVNLGNALRQAGDWEAARHEFTEALRLAPDFAQAHQGLGDLLAELGEHGAASAHWRLGYRDHALNVWTYRGGGQPVRVLMPISVANGNIAARSLLDDRVFEVTTLAMEFYQGVPALPPHDVVFNAIGDADLCGPALAATRDLLAARTTAPVVNHPSKVVSTGRAALAEAFQGIDGIVVPRMACVPRAALLESRGAARLARLGFHFPLLLRAPGFHTGRHFLRVDTPAELAKAAAALPGYHVLAIEYLSGGWSDGKTRKGRVMFIDGRLYPLHWAVSAGWKVHYFTADMADNATHREEEKSFLRDMQGFLGKSATRSLAAISERLGLDYGGIDFGLSSDGKLHVFEANATMAIVPLPLTRFGIIGAPRVTWLFWPHKTCWSRAAPRRPNRKSLLGLFFRKERLSCSKHRKILRRLHHMLAARQHSRRCRFSLMQRQRQLPMRFLPGAVFRIGRDRKEDPHRIDPGLAYGFHRGGVTGLDDGGGECRNDMLCCEGHGTLALL